MGFGMNKFQLVIVFVLFVVYVVFNGLIFFFILFVYIGVLVVNVFVVIVGMFVGMSFFGYIMKRLLFGMRIFFIMVLFGLVIVFVVNIFMKLNEMSIIISFIVILLFVGLIVYDIQCFKEFFMVEGVDEVNCVCVVINGVLSLYINFIVMFVYLL